MGSGWDALTVDRWDALATDEQEAVARAIVRGLGDPWTFEGLTAYELGGQRHRIARFFWRDAAFHLVPGGVPTLGYDRARPFVLNAAQRRAWKMDLYYGQDDADFDWEPADDAESPPIPDDVADHAFAAYLATVLTPLRQRAIPASLLEVDARSAEEQPVPAQEYLSAREMAELRSGRNATIFQRGRRMRVTRTGSEVCVYLLADVYHADVSEQLARDGFRLPTSDEWEYACAAGTRTLFRWGDDCPTEFRPGHEAYDLDAVDSKSRQQIQPRAIWHAYRRPNAFGLRFPTNPYHWELCTDPAIMRGGDGGVTNCGGEGLMKQWVALASSYEHKRHGDPNGQVCGAYVRRVYQLG